MSMWMKPHTRRLSYLLRPHQTLGFFKLIVGHRFKCPKIVWENVVLIMNYILLPTRDNKISNSNWFPCPWYPHSPFKVPKFQFIIVDKPRISSREAFFFGATVSLTIATLNVQKCKYHTSFLGCRWSQTTIGNSFWSS